MYFDTINTQMNIFFAAICNQGLVFMVSALKPFFFFYSYEIGYTQSVKEKPCKQDLALIGRKNPQWCILDHAKVNSNCCRSFSSNKLQQRGSSDYWSILAAIWKDLQVTGRDFFRSWNPARDRSPSQGNWSSDGSSRHAHPPPKRPLKRLPFESDPGQYNQQPPPMLKSLKNHLLNCLLTIDFQPNGNPTLAPGWPGRIPSKIANIGRVIFKSSVNYL